MQNPTIVDANHVSMTNGDQMLRMTTLPSSVTPSHSFQTVNEGGGIYRLQDNVSGSLDSFLMHAIQAAPAGGEAVNVSLTGEDANSWTVSLSSSKGTATIVLNKGINALGGSFGYAASGTPQVTPLADTVQSLTVTEDGPVWGSFPPKTFVGKDMATQGSWKGVYGADGFYLAQDPSGNNPSLPSYATVALTGNSNYTWAGSTSDPRAAEGGRRVDRPAGRLLVRRQQLQLRRAPDRRPGPPGGALRPGLGQPRAERDGAGHRRRDRRDCRHAHRHELPGGDLPGLEPPGQRHP